VSIDIKPTGGGGTFITRSQKRLYRVNIDLLTFEVTKISFGNFLGLPKLETILNRTMLSEAMLPDKEKGEAVLFISLFANNIQCLALRFLFPITCYIAFSVCCLILFSWSIY
jgi:hypothetical protein